MKNINVENVPEAIGPYSQAILVDNLMFSSGQLPIDYQTGLITGDNIEEQSHVIFKNISNLLTSQGLTFNDVIKTTCFLKSMDDFDIFNKVYADYFTSKPARSCLGVSEIPKGALCEVEIIAHKKGGNL